MWYTVKIDLAQHHRAYWVFFGTHNRPVMRRCKRRSKVHRSRAVAQIGYDLRDLSPVAFPVARPKLTFARVASESSLNITGLPKP